MTLWRTLLATLQRTLGTLTTRALGFGVTTALLLGGGAGGTQVSPAYPAEWSMSTLAKFPWVWTCVRAVAGDLAGIPLVAVKCTPGGSKRGRRNLVHDEPALRLLEQPSAGVTGHLLRKQLLVDWLCSGNAYGWRPTEFELIRLHPSVVKPVTLGLAHTIVGYDIHAVVDGRVIEKRLAPSEMLHIRDVSWSPGPDSALGESPIRCLHDDLTMEMGSKARAAEQASRGRPDVLFTTATQLGDKGQSEVKDEWEKAVRKGDGAFVAGRDLKVQVLSWTPKEFEFAQRSEVVRDVVLAVFEVPPARAGLSSANYGTQKQQMRTYWESLVRRAQAWNDALSQLASPGVRIEHDFTDVESLQVSISERLVRVQSHIANGMNPADAYDYEGFYDVPALSAPGVIAHGQPRPSKPEEPQGDKSAPLQLALGAYFTESITRYEQIATAAQGGADTRFLEAWETERLFKVLEAPLRAIADEVSALATARAWAGDVVGATVEATRSGLTAGHNLEELVAFGTERAARLAKRMAA